MLRERHLGQRSQSVLLRSEASHPCSPEGQSNIKEFCEEIFVVIESVDKKEWVRKSVTSQQLRIRTIEYVGRVSIHIEESKNPSMGRRFQDLGLHLLEFI